MNRDQLATRLRALFLGELEEQVGALNAELLALEAEPEHGDHLGAVFRIVHTLKGAADAAQVPRIAGVCHQLEARLARARDEQRPLGDADFALLFQAVDALADAGARLRTGAGLDDAPLAELQRTLDRTPVDEPMPPATRAAPVTEPATAPAPAPAATARPPRDGTHVRVEVDKLDPLLAAAGELGSLANRLADRPAELDELHATARRASSLLGRIARQPGADALDGLTETVRALAEHTGSLAAAARRDARALAHACAEVRDRAHALGLRPLADACVALPRLVRDLATASGKEIELEVSGGDVEVERPVLDVLQEVLLHLVRNAVDHGIEPPEERAALAKPRTARVAVGAALAGEQLVVTVADDGRGLDLAAIRAQLSRRDVAVPGTDAELVEALFRAGFSTRLEPTAVSGRGVGLDVVRTALERIGGSVRVQWREGAGTTFTLECLPRLTTVRALLVAVDTEVLAIPVLHIEHLDHVATGELRRAGGRDVVLTANGPVPVVPLSRLLGPPLQQQAVNGRVQLVRLAAGGRRLAVLVDAMLAEHELTVRSLDGVAPASALVAGAAILPDGRVALVLNTALAVAEGTALAETEPLQLATRAAAPRTRSVLVVDDSLTTRTLEQGILEAAGYRVATAVDGLDGWQQLQDRTYELVVSDDEMPGLDGFELCRRIRGSDRFAQLPVVLVTAMETAEHRARGLEVGADAYLPKSSFDQQELLDTIRQLLG